MPAFPITSCFRKRDASHHSPTSHTHRHQCRQAFLRQDVIERHMFVTIEPEIVGSLTLVWPAKYICPAPAFPHCRGERCAARTTFAVPVANWSAPSPRSVLQAFSLCKDFSDVLAALLRQP